MNVTDSRCLSCLSSAVIPKAPGRTRVTFVLIQACLLAFLPISSSLHADPGKRAFLWFDATANFARLSTRDSIVYYLDRCAALGFTDVVVDVKPITGEVLYPSAFAPRMNSWNGFTRPETFDFLGVFLGEARQRRLRVHASLNVFVAGHNYFDRGLVYSTNPEWQSLLNTDSGLVPITRMKNKYSAMTNPVDETVRSHELRLLHELVSHYPLDGVILDRVRYDGIEADFSERSHKEFEKYLGERVDRFPADIFEWKKGPDERPFRVKGRYYKQWLEWRAWVIRQFIRDARDIVKRVNPRISFGVYAGSWYPIYYEVGVNWASRKYDPSKRYAWATESYRNTGYAEILDFFISGNYYFELTKEEALKAPSKGSEESGAVAKNEYWQSVEGSCEIVREVTKGVVPVYGGLYVEQYRGHPEQFEKAIAMCLRKSDGLMIFDVVHIVNFGWWEVLRRGMKAGEN